MWRFFGIIAACAAVTKPLLGINDKISHINEILVGYKSLDHDLHCLSLLIKQEKKYDKNMKQQFFNLLEKKKELITANKVEIDNKRLQNICEQEVITELPVDSFYIPEDYINE